MRIPSHLRTVALTLAASLLVVACGSDADVSTALGTGPTASVETGTITVFAAASLKGTFTEIGEIFEEENPGSQVTFSFAGSSDLVTQILGGAPADVFASADENTMAKATDGGVVDGEPANFATNTLAIVVPPDNPAGITSFSDLAKDSVNEVVCAPQVPCGSATKKVETGTGVSLTPISEEQSVTDVLNKVTTGEADAGVVYVTDAKAAGDDVEEVPFAESASAVNTYPIAVLGDADRPELAHRFVDLVTGPGGQAVLEAAGFAPAA